jgi:hypothetical protein
MVWGWQSASMTNTASSGAFDDRRHNAMASAAAVASSSNEAFATSRPVRSATIV